MKTAEITYQFSIDCPTNWTTPARRICISGWCFDPSGRDIHAVRAAVQKRTFPGNYGIARFDVAQVYPEHGNAARSGFAIAAELPPGEATLQLQIRQVDGNWHTFLSEKITGAPAGAPREISPEPAALFDPRSPAGSINCASGPRASAIFIFPAGVLPPRARM